MKNDNALTITALAPLIRRRKISPVEITKFLLERISRLQPSINAYITVTAELALKQARQAEREIAKGHYRGVLHGIPVSLKDLIDTCGIPTTAGSRVFRARIPEQNAPVVDRLLRAGCILLGKTNMHEFAYGATNVNPHYGSVRNPWNHEHMSGGSSGGSAASVISAQAIASIGTDTGGSIRIPSAACGCVGFKPTCGRISLNGIIPLSTTLDHAGPLTRCVLDSAYLLDILADQSLWNLNSAKTAKDIRKEIRSLRIGIPRQYFFDRIQPEVRRTVLRAIGVFEQLGVEVVELNLKMMEETQRLAAEITGCEAFAYHEKMLAKKSRDYGEDVRSRLEQSSNMPASEYIRTLQQRDAYNREFDRALASVQVIVAPTLPIVAPRIEDREVSIGKSHEDARIALLRLTRPGNLTGLPAISVPCGFTPLQLPVGLQIIGRRFDEISVLRMAYTFESATRWHEHFPPDPGERGYP